MHFLRFPLIVSLLWHGILFLALVDVPDPNKVPRKHGSTTSQVHLKIRPSQEPPLSGHLAARTAPHEEQQHSASGSMDPSPGPSSGHSAATKEAQDSTPGQNSGKRSSLTYADLLDVNGTLPLGEDLEGSEKGTSRRNAYQGEHLGSLIGKSNDISAPFDLPLVFRRDVGSVREESEESEGARLYCKPWQNHG